MKLETEINFIYIYTTGKRERMKRKSRKIKKKIQIRKHYLKNKQIVFYFFSILPCLIRFTLFQVFQIFVDSFASHDSNLSVVSE